jgi:hypothetical protein
MDIDTALYPGGFHTLMQRLERRETPFKDAESEIPPPGADLQAMAGTMIPPQEDDPDPARGKRMIRTKWLAFRREFEGRPELFARHALMVAILRRRSPPDAARALFLRMWQEQGPLLARELPVRWLISAATTFADHGATADQRLCGQGLSLLFDLIKLHDSERRVSGRPNDQGFAQIRGRQRHSMAFDLVPYSLPDGDLDMNLLARLWRHTENDPVIRPLGQHMLRMVMHDPRTVFGRIQRYKKRRSADDRA